MGIIRQSFVILKMDKLEFKSMTLVHIPLWQTWIKQAHVAEVWFIEGYETPDYIYQKIQGNGYDFPFIIYMNTQPIGYIVCCDLYSYRNTCPHPKGLFTAEEAGAFCMDLFIGEQEYLNKGYGTQIVKAFAQYIFTQFKANKLLIDPAVSNKRAIRCYEKAGFEFLKQACDGVTVCHVMQKLF